MINDILLGAFEGKIDLDDVKAMKIRDMSTEEFRIYLRCRCGHITIFKSPYVYETILDDAREVVCGVCSCCPIDIDRITRVDMEGIEVELGEENDKEDDGVEETQPPDDSA